MSCWKTIAQPPLRLSLQSQIQQQAVVEHCRWAVQLYSLDESQDKIAFNIKHSLATVYPFSPSIHRVAP